MGEAKRRQELTTAQGAQKQPWWTKEKSAEFVRITTRGAWIGIGVMIAYWVVIRFIGPALGWWHLVD